MSPIRDEINNLLAKPGLYIGWWGIERLFVYLQGYQGGYHDALRSRDVSQAEDDYFRGFTDFVAEQYDASPGGRSWAMLIEERVAGTGRPGEAPEEMTILEQLAKGRSPRDEATYAEFVRLWDLYQKMKG